MRQDADRVFHHVLIVVLTAVTVLSWASGGLSPLAGVVCWLAITALVVVPRWDEH